MKTHINYKFHKTGNRYRRLFSGMIVLFFSLLAVNQLSAQSFILDLEYNPMTFTNANRTVINDPGSNGGLSQGSVHRYDNVVTKDGIEVYAHLTLLEVNNATIINFDDDNQTGDSERFQPRIGSNNGGGYILYQLEFFDTDTDKDVFLYDYYVTGVDTDGNGSNREYAEYSGYESYLVNDPTQLTISTNQSTGRTRFLGRSSSLSGVTFDNTCSYIVNYSNPNNKMTFLLGQTEQNNVRYYSVRFGVAGGTFTNPDVVYNPLPVAVDDNGTPLNGATGGVAVSNVLDNDLYDGNPVNLADVNISVVNPASNGGVELNTTNGEVTVAPGTPAGVYTIDYQICMVSSPGSCDIATITVTVLEADLEISKTVNPNPVIEGQAIAYTVTVTNNGPFKALDVEVEDVLPGELSFVSATPSTGSWSDPVWTIGTMNNGDSETLTIVAEVNSGVSGDVDNTATVSSSTADPNAANNSDTETLTVEAVTPIVNNFPATGYGTLAFEDLWPGKGDYDFNDLVLDYKFVITTNNSNMVETLEGTFIIKAFGAALENGFGFQLSDAIDPADLTVTGYSLTENYITLNSNGTEAGQSKPTIIVYDNAFNEMAHPGTGIGVNTDPAAPYVNPVILNITITFPDNTYSYADLDIANFNPFLIVDLNRGVEVHLPNYLPTDLADQSLLGTMEDSSDPGTGRYYKTENNLPWAINIYESFDYPKEKVSIIDAYLKFAQWAESGGTEYQDWYLDLNDYRNPSNIYQIP